LQQNPFEDINDEHLLWADLVMVSAMYAQRADARSILARARALGRRTLIGGPWASSEPEAVLADADHVLAGEAEEVFAGIAAALERGPCSSPWFDPQRECHETSERRPRGAPAQGDRRVLKTKRSIHSSSEDRITKPMPD